MPRGEALIRRVRLYDVALPLRRPFAISGGTLEVRRSLIVEVEDDDGVKGYGESAPFERPFYSSETLSSARSCLQDVLVPRVLSDPVHRLEDMRELLADGVRGNRMARAGVETAWWDLRARQREVSLTSLVVERLAALGVPPAARRPRPRIECGIALGIPAGEDLGRLRGWVEDALARGYGRIKLKIRPGWDCRPVAAVREVIRRTAKKILLWVDANGAYDLPAHRHALMDLDDLGLCFVEQPFAPHATWDAAVWNREAATPVCIDESLVSDVVARQTVEMGGPAIWNLKVQRLGGLEETCRVYARGVATGARLWVGTMPETGVGARAALAIASLSGCVFPTDVEPSERWYEPGVDLHELEMDAEGMMRVPDVGGPSPRLGGATLLAQMDRP